MGPVPCPTPCLTLSRDVQPETDLEVKRSHFLARAARTDTEEEARAFIASVRAAHPAARHHCSAFIVGTGDGRPAERSNDDGEPSGTAGRPILDTLRGTGLTCASVVVSRYFGGTLLGTGGLVRAYSRAAAQALAAATRVRLQTRQLWTVRVPVARAGRVEAQLRDHPTTLAGRLTVDKTTWGSAHAVLLLSSALYDAAEMTEILSAATQGAAAPEPAGTRLVEIVVDTDE